MKIGLVFGGPSLERGISLNSARTVMDNLKPFGWEIIPLYCDLECKFHQLSQGYLYSNTPSDFDFKLKEISEPFDKSKFIEYCKNNKIDIVFPVIHGAFGEDGNLQELLEEYEIPFVGSSSSSCYRMFDKVNAKNEMEKNGFVTLPNYCIEEQDTHEVKLQKATDCFKHTDVKKVVVKPSSGGSSIGVATAKTPQEAVSHAEYILDNMLGGCAMIEPYCEGREFTVFVLENPKNEPVALVPTEIRLFGSDIFTYRTKYLPSLHVEYHCPPRFNDTVIRQIQKSAEKLFKHFEMNDFVRIDGWLLKDGSLIFSDFNPISGMEQNSDMFIQGSRIGFTHGEMLRYIVTNAARRYGICFSEKNVTKNPKAQKIRVLFGGETSERQVSVMSGTNVWLQLWNSRDFLPTPYLFISNNEVWELPYSFTLNYTVEEIQANCKKAKEKIIDRLLCFSDDIMSRLEVLFLKNKTIQNPTRMNLDEFYNTAKEKGDFVFIALHGGYGENGRLQSELNKRLIAYNGSDEDASDLCMDKFRTGLCIDSLQNSKLCSAKKKLLKICKNKDEIVYKIVKNEKIKEEEIKEGELKEEEITEEELKEEEITEEELWDRVCNDLGKNKLIIKPLDDGCSTGVVCLEGADHLKKYLRAVNQGQKVLSLIISNKYKMVELPEKVDKFILEPFIETDEIRVSGHDLVHKPKKGWIELTVGIWENSERYHVLTPSITVAKEDVLSVEEKFQGGTGVNLTPPPNSIITKEQIDLIKENIEETAKALKIHGYARIDIFFNTKCNKTMLIEANTLPCLAPSTVIFQQAYLERETKSNEPLTPQAFLYNQIDFGNKRLSSKIK